jgi:hypothetical protein
MQRMIKFLILIVLSGNAFAGEIENTEPTRPLVELLCLEEQGRFGDKKLPVDKQMSAMIERFKKYALMVKSKEEEKAFKKAIDAAAEQILKAGRQKVKDAEEQLKDAKETQKLGASVRT